jgi:hypothetical protein
MAGESFTLDGGRVRSAKGLNEGTRRVGPMTCSLPVFTDSRVTDEPIRVGERLGRWLAPVFLITAKSVRLNDSLD